MIYIYSQIYSRLLRLSLTVKLDKPLDLKAVRLVESNCIDIKWNKVESGACIVKYDVKLKDASGNYYHNKVGYNIREMKFCNVTDFDIITNVEMVVNFKNVTSKGSEANIVESTSLGMIICSYCFAFA